MNLALTRQLALLQARLHSLETVQDQIRERDTRHELFRLRAEATEQLRRHHAAGDAPADPLEYVCDELACWNRWLESVREAVAPAIAAGTEPPSTPSRRDLEDRLRCVSRWRTELATCLSQLQA